MVTLLKMLLAGWALSLLMGCCTWWAARPDDDVGMSQYHGSEYHSSTVTRDTVVRETIYTDGGIPYPERASAAWW